VKGDGSRGWGKCELAKSNASFQGVDHSFQQLPASDRRRERVNFNIPEAFSAVANAKKSLEKCGGVLH
jgi:hypothetical protein